MENAGKEVEDAESKKAMAECGIGTPATRANIIETLILRDYICRDKKSIIPTEIGLAVYEIVKDKKIANAEMTGRCSDTTLSHCLALIVFLHFLASILHSRKQCRFCVERFRFGLMLGDVCIDK